MNDLLADISDVLLDFVQPTASARQPDSAQPTFASSSTSPAVPHNVIGDPTCCYLCARRDSRRAQSLSRPS
jgi:hypothetical protein